MVSTAWSEKYRIFFFVIKSSISLHTHPLSLALSLPHHIARFPFFMYSHIWLFHTKFPSFCASRVNFKNFYVVDGVNVLELRVNEKERESFFT